MIHIAYRNHTINARKKLILISVHVMYLVCICSVLRKTCSLETFPYTTDMVPAHKTHFYELLALTQITIYYCNDNCINIPDRRERIFL